MQAFLIRGQNQLTKLIFNSLNLRKSVTILNFDI